MAGVGAPTRASYCEAMDDAVRALEAQLEKELAAIMESLEFWRDQPPSMMDLSPGMTDLSVNRVSDLEDDAEGIRAALRILRAPEA